MPNIYSISDPDDVNKQAAVANAAPAADADGLVVRPIVGTLTVEQHDDFSGGEYFADQAGADAVVTFTFSSQVQLVVVEANGNTEARLDPFGGTPGATTGIPCRDEVIMWIPVKATSVKAYIPIGTTLHVWGFRH